MTTNKGKSGTRSKTQGIVLAGAIAVAASVLVVLTHAPKKAVSKPHPSAVAVMPQIADVKSDSEIVFRGKSFPMFQRDVRVWFAGEVIKVSVAEGDEVKEGQILATYRLDRSARIQVRNFLYPSQLVNLRNGVKANQLAMKKILEVDTKNMELNREQALKRLTNIRALHAKGMASADAVKNAENHMERIERSIAVFWDNVETKKTRMAKLETDLEFTEGRRKHDLELLEWQAQRSFSDESIPIEQAFLKAPIAGRIIWMHPEFRVSAEVPRGFVAMKVAPANGAVVRCKAHELELVKLREGDRATISFDAISDKEYPARVSRLPWISRNATLEVPADYTVEFVLMNPDLKVKGGMTCSAKVSTTP